MKLLYSLMTISLLFSCSIKLDLTSSSGHQTLKEANFFIDNFSPIGWSVGSDDRTHIHKGFTLTLFYPKLTNDIKKNLLEKKIDSWLIQFNRIKNGGRETLGYIRIPFKQTITNFYLPYIMKRHNKFFIKIIYASIAPSKRFEKFECPAFGHDRKISQTSYESMYPVKVINIFPHHTISYPYKELITGGFQAIEFNGGQTLKGKYFTRAALFNSKEQTLYSDFQESDNYLFIEEEERVTIPGCSESSPTPPRKNSDNNDIQRFKFGKRE